MSRVLKLVYMMVMFIGSAIAFLCRSWNIQLHVSNKQLHTNDRHSNVCYVQKTEKPYTNAST